NLKDTLIIVTADHSTCSLLRRHCRISIPILISGADKNTVEKFSEKNCRKGKLGKIKQINLMTEILKYAK
ncbi:phosphoglycerate mutase, partial [bacterium]|nr:phosphoglycerate mutase [bacterium]